MRTLCHQRGLRLGISPVHGVLVHGPPGCSKTIVAKAAAHAAQATFYLSGAKLYSMHVGKGESVLLNTLIRPGHFVLLMTLRKLISRVVDPKLAHFSAPNHTLCSTIRKDARVTYVPPPDLEAEDVRCNVAGPAKWTTPIENLRKHSSDTPGIEAFGSNTERSMKS